MKTWILILLTATALSAQQEIPWGQEFRVNSYTKNDQRLPSVAGLSDGGFVVCWMSALQDGPYYDIYAQRYGVDGKPFGGEFRVNSYIENDQIYPSVAALSDGGFVVCWMSDNQNEFRSGTYAQRYGADGKPTGGEFLVINYTKGWHYNPGVAGLSDGGFAVCWDSRSKYDVVDNWVDSQVYGSDGKPVGGEFRVSSNTEDMQLSSSVTGLSGRGFAVCWSSIRQDYSDYGVYAKFYRSDGKSVGGEFRVDSYTKDYYDLYGSSITGLSGSGFVVCWILRAKDGLREYSIYAHRYNADGKPMGGEFRVDSYSRENLSAPCVSALSGGGFVASWDSWGLNGSYRAIYAHCYDAGGEPMGGEFRVNSITGIDKIHPSIAGLPGSGFVVCWESEGLDGDGYNVCGKRFPAEPLRHQLRPFVLLQPVYDATVTTGKPTLTWQKSSKLTVAYPWELEYTVYYDTLADFTTASFKATGLDTTIKLPTLKLGKTYFWKVLAKTYYGDSLWSEVSAFFVSHTATGVEEAAVPGQFAVLSNYPNPFNPSTTLRFELPIDGCVTVKIYDLSGRLVKTLLSGEQIAGTHTAVWDGTDDAGRQVAAGVYFYRAEYTDAFGKTWVQTKKMSLVK